MRARRCGTADDVHKIDAVAHLSYGRSINHTIQGRGDVLGADPELTRLVLNHVDLHDPRGLVPVEDHAGEMWIRAHDGGEALRELADLRDVRPAHPVLHGAADRRSELQWLDQRVGPGKVFFKYASNCALRWSRALMQPLVTTMSSPKHVLSV